MTGDDAGPRWEGRLFTDRLPTRGPAVSDPVTYTAVLSVAEETVQFVSGLLAAERRRRGTRGRRRALGCYRQAVLVLRWFLDRTRLAQLACDNRIGRSTAYRYLHEGIDALAVAAPGLRGALLAARAAGHSHVTVDGTLIRTDRCSVAGPTARADRSEQRVDLWWSGKHACHGGNVQVIAAPDGWPIWTSGVRPGREHDTTALRAHPEALPLLVEWTDDDHAALADLGYEQGRGKVRTVGLTCGDPDRRPRPASAGTAVARTCSWGVLLLPGQSDPAVRSPTRRRRWASCRSLLTVTSVQVRC